MIDVGANTLIKIGVGLLAFVAFCVGLIWYGESRKQLEWDAAVMAQATKTATQVVAAAENTAKVQTKYIKVAGETKVVVKEVEKEVIKYVETPATKCLLSPGFERMFDRISGVLDGGASDDLSAADATTSESPVSTGPAITDAEVLRAYTAAIVQQREQADRYRALSEWVETNYAVSRP